MSNQKWSFYRGVIINPKNDTTCDFFQGGMLAVYGEKVQALCAWKAGSKKYAGKMNAANTTDFGRSLILPGFFDMHFHWVQDDVREMPKDQLMQWLELYTFPAEAKFADPKYAEAKAKFFFEKLLKTGTVGGACYSSIHEHALASAMKHVKGDFVIGNVLMTQNSPEALTQTETEALAITKRSIEKYGKRHAFTPRFVPTTSLKVMKEGAKLADRAKCFKQTHLSENIDEIKFVESQNPGLSYTEVYQKAGMLGERSLMGHGIHLGDKELKILSKTKTVIVHCPTSNAPVEEKGLGSGLFDFKKVERAKIRWALGSDIGGGPYLSMFDVMRSFVDQNARAKVKGATYVKALYRATLAGAEILGLKKTNGNLSVGKKANFIVVPLTDAATKRAEQVLESVIAPHASRREQYDNLVSFVKLV